MNIIEMAKECGAISYSRPPMRAVRGVSFEFEQLQTFADRIAEIARQEACAAIKVEAAYCYDNGDYMLCADDCIEIINGSWTRPNYD